MSKITQYVRHLAVVAMATLAAQCAWAALPTTNVISWNVAQDDSNQRNTGLVDTTAESYPTLAGDIPGSCWNQPANYSAEVVVSEFNAETGSARQLSTTFSDYISGGYNIKPDGAETPAYRKAYLARLNNGSVYGQVTINNIPYLKYDLIVYFSGASDVSVYKPLQINGGTYYKGQDGSTVVAASSDTWGDNSATEIAEGTNALVIRGLGNRKLILKNDGVVKNGICAVQIVDRSGTAKSLPIMLFNVYGGGSEVAGWSNVTQSNGASIPSSGALSTNSVSFVAAMPNSNFGGNFAPANACGTDFESGTYVDVFGESHETIAAEVKASLSLPEDVVFDSSIYKTGVINGGYNGQVGTISGLSPDQGYVVYAGFGRKGNDVTYFKMESSGFGSADSIDYVTTVARTSGNVTVKATEYTEYTVGSMIGPGSTDGLLLVRMANVKPNADGNIVFSLGGGRSGLNWVAVAKVDIQTVAKIGNKNFSSLSAALAAAEAATSEEGKIITLLAPHTGNVAIASGVTIEMNVNNRITGAISGAGTVKLSHASTATQGSLTTWIGDGKMTFAAFTGTVHLAAGRFNATSALVPATAKIKVTNGAQLFVDGGTWTNTIELEGAGYGNETTHIGRAALRFEQGNIDGATIESNATGDNAPAIGSYGSDRIFAFKLIGTGDIRLVLGSGSHTYKFTNKETTLSGTVTIVDANLTLEAEVSEGEDVFPNDIAGAGTLKKSGEGALTLSGNVSCAVKLAAGTIVSETVTGEVTTDVAGMAVAFDEATLTYSLIPAEITFTVAGLPEHAATYVQINAGTITPIVNGQFAVVPGDKFVVWFAPAEGYVGNTLSTGVVTVVYPMQTTEIQSPTAEQMNIRKAVAYAFVGDPEDPEYIEFASLAEAIVATGAIQVGPLESISENVVIGEGTGVTMSAGKEDATLSPADATQFTIDVKGSLVIDGLTINGKVGLTTAASMVAVMDGTTVPEMETTVEGKKIVSGSTLIPGMTAYKLVDDIPEKPTASVDTLTEGVPADLQSAYVFSTVEPTEKQAEYYDLWNANFEVSFDKDVKAGSILLKGAYDAWLGGEWVEMTMTGDLAKDAVWTLLPTDQVQYRDVLAIGTFKCGVANLDAANKDTIMTVKLVLTSGEDRLEIVTQTYKLEAPKVMRPSEVEGGSTDQKSAYDKWAKEAGSLSGLTNAQIIDRFIFNVDADTPDEDLEDALDEVIEKTDCFAKLMAEIAKGNDPTAYTFTLEVYPNATFKFVEVPETEIKTSAQLFRLTATFVPANDK